MAGGMRMGMPTGGGLTGLLKDGYRHFSGLEDAIMKNVGACKELSEITRTSLGPNGMNKLVLSHLEKIFVTSDAATILTELEVAHPAARMLVMAAKMQEQEVGDGSNLVVTLAGELLSKAEDLLRTGVHPSDIVSGFKKAGEHVVSLLAEKVVMTVSEEEVRDRTKLARVLRAVLAAKQHGHEDILAPLVAEACSNVMPPAPKRPSINMDNVRVAKIIGGTVRDSQVVRGMVVHRDAEGTIKHVESGKVAVFGIGLEASSTETKGTVVIHNAEELKSYNKSEEKMMEDVIKAIADAGVKVIVAGGAISEIALHFIEKYGMMAIKIFSKFELRRLCRTVHATACVRLAAPTEAELGYVDEVSIQELSGTRVAVFRQDAEDSGVATIVLRGSTMSALDDMERAIDDATNVTKVLCSDGRCLPGGGAIEMQLSLSLQRLADETPGLEQYAIRQFAEALEVVPRTLAENSGQSPTEVMSGLYAAHAGGAAATGVNVAGVGVTDMVALDIYDSFAVKISALRLAADAAVTVLRVDQIIMSKQAGGPKPRDAGPPDQD